MLLLIYEKDLADHPYCKLTQGMNAKLLIINNTLDMSRQLHFYNRDIQNRTISLNFALGSWCPIRQMAGS